MQQWCRCVREIDIAALRMYLSRYEAHIKHKMTLHSRNCSLSYCCLVGRCKERERESTEVSCEWLCSCAFHSRIWRCVLSRIFTCPANAFSRPSQTKMLVWGLASFSSIAAGRFCPVAFPSTSLLDAGHTSRDLSSPRKATIKPLVRAHT